MTMLLGDLLEKVDIVDAKAEMDLEINGISFDTRTLKTGDVFFAIKGYATDGNRFIGEAAEKGALCVISEEQPDARVPFIIVPDARKALSLASAAWFGYPAGKLKLIGVTGTNGKTTVTNLIKHVVEECAGVKVGLIGTNGNMIGDMELHAERTTPESYEFQELLSRMADAGCGYVVAEVSSHALQLSRVYGVPFEVGVFTNLTNDHLDFHASLEEYAAAKSLLFSGCRSAAFNIDDERAPLMMSTAAGTVLTFAINDDSADLVAKDVKLHTDKVEFCALTIGSLNRVELGIPGLFSVYNALAAISAVMLLGFDAGQIASAMQSCRGVKGRAEIVPAGRDYTVLIDYAHTPDALKNIILAARTFARGRVVTLFGCGGDRDKTKRPRMGAIAAEYSDFVVVTSDNPRTEEPRDIINNILSGMEGTKTPYCVIENRREAIFWALDNSMADDVLILAGKGHETYQIFGREKRHFDEREVVGEYFTKG